ncbi:MAG: DNA-binding protein [Lachnospiraceae bacterium]|nr:DNA-binding protein [Lachnospiraceae bacterium]
MKSIKEMVELTGFSYMHLRNLCLENKIVHIRAGKKYLINYDRFCDYLNGIGQ